jgi:hypothetical protein
LRDRGSGNESQAQKGATLFTTSLITGRTNGIAA